MLTVTLHTLSVPRACLLGGGQGVQSRLCPASLGIRLCFQSGKLSHLLSMQQPSLRLLLLHFLLKLALGCKQHAAVTGFFWHSATNWKLVQVGGSDTTEQGAIVTCGMLVGIQFLLNGHPNQSICTSLSGLNLLHTSRGHAGRQCSTSQNGSSSRIQFKTKRGSPALTCSRSCSSLATLLCWSANLVLRSSSSRSQSFSFLPVRLMSSFNATTSGFCSHTTQQSCNSQSGHISPRPLSHPTTDAKGC